MQSVIVLDESKMATLANDQRVLKLLPFFGARVSKPHCCGKPPMQFPDFNTIRHCIVHMDETKQKQLKELLGVSGVILHHHDGNKINEISF